MSISQNKPNLSRSLFWDVDYDNLDYDKYAHFVIERVLERGTLDEWREIKKYFGIGKIKTVSLEARYLNQKVLHFCSAIFETPIEQFRCYKLQRSTQAPWPL